MKEIFRKYSGGNPHLLIAPTIWAFLENLCTMLPAIFVMLAIGQLISPIIAPGAVGADAMETALWRCCLGMVAAMLLQGAVSILSYRYTYYASQRAMGQMRLDIVEKMREFPLGFYDKKQSGELSNAFLTDPDGLDQAIAYFIPQIISMGALSVLSFVMLMAIDWRLALPMYSSMPLCLVLMAVSMRMRHHHASSIRAARAQATTLLNEYLLGMRNLKSYNQTGAGFGRLDAAYRALANESTKDEGWPGTVTLLAGHTLQIGIPLIIFTGAMLLTAGRVDLIYLLLFLILATRLYAPLSNVIMNLVHLRACRVAADRIDALRREPEQSGSGTQVPQGDIRFEQVRFSYDGEKEILHNVSFTAARNSLTALVGPSGSGKSTLLRLACRFWDAQGGAVFIGGTAISGLAPEALYQKISMVFQENVLFGDSIRNNLLFGQADKTEDEMILACQKACCHDFIMRLPQGYDTVIGEGGATLSGGERQRIAIARAILKDAPILLLDEPTASLDAENEALVQNALAELVQGKTVIMVAHRLKTVAAANQIVVLEQGRIVQSGTHKELLNEEGGLYRHLWSLQEKAQSWSISSKQYEEKKT